MYVCVCVGIPRITTNGGMNHPQRMGHESCWGFVFNPFATSRRFMFFLCFSLFQCSAVDSLLFLKKLPNIHPFLSLFLPCFA